MVYHNDRPLSNPETDALGYAHFAKNIALAIKNLDSSEGFVIGLYGAWGTGKSTVLQFIEYYLLNLPDVEDIIILHFNPWWFSDREDLTRVFFEQLQLSLTSSFAKIAREGMEKLVKLVQVFSKMVSKAPVPGAELAEEITNLLPDFEIGDVVKFKRELDKKLKELDTPILIIIDDIDRLSANEIQHIFQLVKSVADFSNVIYLLAFDAEIVSQALAEVQNLPGEEYLEKIIQLPLTLPIPSSNAITRLFENQLNVLFPSGTPMYDEQRLRYFYREGIDKILQTPRDVVRLSNAMRFTYPLVKGEVNIADFIVIEVIRVFEPKLYNIIRNNKKHFADSISFLQFHNLQRDEFIQFHKTWIESYSEYKNLLNKLFPKLQNVDRPGTFSHDGMLISWRRSCYVASGDIFDTYFRLALDSKLSQERMDSIIESCTDIDFFKSHLIELAKENNPDGSNSLDLFLDRIRDYRFDDKINQNARNIITVFLEIGDRLYDRYENLIPKGLLQIDRHERIAYVITNLLRDVSPETRFNTIKDCFEVGQSLAIMATVIVTLGHDHGEYGNDVVISRPTITREELSQLEQIFVDKVQNCAEENTLISMPIIRRILSVWEKNDPDNAHEWVDSIQEDTTSILTLFVAFLGIQQRYSEQRTEHNFAFAWEDLLRYIRPEVVLELVASIVTKVNSGEIELSLHEQEALHLIVDELKSEVNNKGAE